MPLPGKMQPYDPKEGEPYETSYEPHENAPLNSGGDKAIYNDFSVEQSSLRDHMNVFYGCWFRPVGLVASTITLTILNAMFAQFLFMSSIAYSLKTAWTCYPDCRFDVDLLGRLFTVFLSVAGISCFAYLIFAFLHIVPLTGFCTLMFRCAQGPSRIGKLQYFITYALISFSSTFSFVISVVLLFLGGNIQRLSFEPQYTDVVVKIHGLWSSIAIIGYIYGALLFLGFLFSLAWSIILFIQWRKQADE